MERLNCEMCLVSYDSQYLWFSLYPDGSHARLCKRCIENDAGPGYSKLQIGRVAKALNQSGLAPTNFCK